MYSLLLKKIELVHALAALLNTLPSTSYIKGRTGPRANLDAVENGISCASAVNRKMLSCVV
jgi:hypothetical protein